MMTCSCTRRAGFTERGGWWVCASCGLPAPKYARAAVLGQFINGSPNRKEPLVPLVMFRGGPLDGYVYETKTLLGEEAVSLPIIEYKWTSEKVRSETTGAVAQVWLHHTLVNGAPDQPSAATAARLATEVPVAPTPPVPAPAAPQPVSAHVVVETGAVATLERTAPVQEAAAAPEPAPVVEVGHVGIPTGDVSYENLLERRKALKLSREQARDGTGLAISKIIAIENNSGKRVKDEERRTLAEWVAAQEAGAGARV